GLSRARLGREGGAGPVLHLGASKSLCSPQPLHQISHHDQPGHPLHLPSAPEMMGTRAVHAASPKTPQGPSLQWLKKLRANTSGDRQEAASPTANKKGKGKKIPPETTNYSLRIKGHTLARTLTGASSSERRPRRSRVSTDPTWGCGWCGEHSLP
ncbi:unnamed protein product, partial [Gulo gulo]